MIIDGHSHVSFPVHKHIELMDRAGVDKTILFTTMVHPETAINFGDLQTEMQRLDKIIRGDVSAAVKARRNAIKELKSAVTAYPDRYIGFGPVPVGLTDQETNTYIEEQVVSNGFVGLGEFTLPSGAISKLRPILQASRNYGNLPLWIHAFNPLVLKDINEIAQLAVEFSDVPIIVGHLGGSNWRETITFVKEIANLYIDISAYFSTLVLKIAINELPHKCIFGVDLPYGDLELSINAVKRLSDSEVVLNLILGENMASLLKL